MSGEQGSRPNFTVQAMERNGARRGPVGVAWAKTSPKDGKPWISIALSPGVTISWKDDLVLSLWPIQGQEPAQAQPRRSPADDLNAAADRREQAAGGGEEFPF